jgi:Legionella pneumophila major outer membrane protein precursor
MNKIFYFFLFSTLFCRDVSGEELFYKKTRKNDAAPEENKELKIIRASGDLIYFKAVQDSLVYVFKTPEVGAPVTGVSTLVEPDWKYSPGFRLSAFAPMYYDGWEVGISWTDFRQKITNKESSDKEVPELYAVMAQSSISENGSPFVADVSARWKIGMDVFDLTVERTVPLLTSFSIRPVFGVEGAVVTENVDVHYDKYYVFIPAALPTRVKIRNNMWGVGPKIALWLDFCLPKQVSIDCLTAISGLFGVGSAKTKYLDYIDDTGQVPPETVVTLKNITDRLFSKIQLQGSLKKVWSLSQGELSLLVGWETQIWFRMNRIPFYGTIDTEFPGADLTFSGPFARASLEF